MDNDIKCKMKEKKSDKATDMGTNSHPGLSPKIVIPRTFRWTLTNENHLDIHWWIQCVKTDYVTKKINLDVFDDAKGAVFNWIQALISEEKSALTAALTHLDGSGNAISTIAFDGLKIEDHSTVYNYGNSEVLTHKIVLSYRKIKRTNQLNVQ